MEERGTTSVSVFISYAHEDQELYEKLRAYLNPLKDVGKISIWSDKEISAGTNWEDQINTHLNEADIILLLVSEGFLNSNYCWNQELPRALERHKAGTARVIPIILSPAYWKNTPLGHLQVLPTNAKPITLWADPDVAFVEVIREVRHVVQELLVQKSVVPSKPQQSFHKRLHEEREKRGWSQQELAEKIGVTVMTIRRWEKKITIPTPYYRQILGELFQMDAEALGLMFTLQEAHERREWSQQGLAKKIITIKPLMLDELLQMDAEALGLVSTLQEEREKRGWSQQELAEKIGVTVMTIARWETKITTPTPYYRQRLGELFQMDAEALGLVSTLPKEVKSSHVHIQSHVYEVSILPSGWAVRYYQLLGKVFLTLKLYKMALVVYEKALLLQPDNPTLFLRKGEALLGLQKSEDALAIYERALLLDPNSSVACRGQGRVYEQRAKQVFDTMKQQAQECYEKAKELGAE